MDKGAAFRFLPFSPKQVRLLTWWCDASPVKGRNGVIADGAIRSGKTLCMSLSFVLWAMARFDGQAFALCGKTIGSLRRNVLNTLLQMLPGRGFAAVYRRTDNLVTVRRGGRENHFYLFGGKDDHSQDLIQGITLAGAFFDEAALMPEGFVEQATARCSVAGSTWWFNCNPAGPEHWFYRKWIGRAAEKGLLYLHFSMDDNWSLPEEIKARYRSQYAGVFYERFILGRWVAAEGLVYGHFDRAAHTAARLPRCCTHPDEAVGRYFVSIDYGTVNPFSAGLWCLFDGVATRIAEYYHDPRGDEHRGARRTDEEHYAALEALCRRMVTRADGRAEPQDYPVEAVVIDPSAASMVECIRRHGRFAVRRADNAVLPGIETVASLLAAGMLKFHVGCADCLREFGAYRWDEASGRDAVLKEHDHAMDDTRYFCYTILRRELRWEAWERG